MSDARIFLVDPDAAVRCDGDDGRTSTALALEQPAAFSGLGLKTILGPSVEEVLEENSHLYELLDSLNVPVLTFSSGMHLHSFNPDAAALLGIGDADLGKRYEGLRPFSESARPACVRIFNFSRDLTAPGFDGQDWLCRMFPHVSCRCGSRGVTVVFLAPASTEVPEALRPAWAEQLTNRQREIMELVLSGHPSKNIAYTLQISQRTVESHRSEIMRRTGAKSLASLVRIACGQARSDDFR